jgi:deoxyribodipyrimidine photo-lyase
MVEWEVLEFKIMNKTTVFWFRRDLRINDNCGLYNALISSKNVLPVFIFDKNILRHLPKKDARIEFILSSLNSLNKTLKNKGSMLAQYKGNPIDVFKKLCLNYNIEKVVFNRDYEPYAIKRDKEIKLFLESKEILVEDYKDQVFFETNEIVKDDGSPYKVYTPYSNKWLKYFKSSPLIDYDTSNCLDNFIKEKKFPQLFLEDLGFEKSDIIVPDFILTKDLINDYEKTRNFPGLDSTSKLGPYLRFGIISVREIIRLASRSSNNVFLKELIWREFFMQILWHFPKTENTSFRPIYDRIQWINDKNKFKLWCEGKTGYPLVDAGMRELNQTGFMHNRVRMLVGSFLCKHLLIDWKWGESYFSEKLLDYEMSSNVGNWQWVAGCGVDASPYFRIFNPSEQVKKFDKKLKYIKKWVNDLDSPNYPKPIVDHKTARINCLKTYKEALVK